MSWDLSEFETTLKRQGPTLSFPIGRSLTVALDFFGFRPGQDVLISFEHERLEVRPRNTPREIQVKMKAGAEELRKFKKRMQELMGKLPATSEDELAAAETLEGELLGTLECLVVDDLEPAIQKLESAASLKLKPSSKAAKPVAKRRRPGQPKGRRKASR